MDTKDVVYALGLVVTLVLGIWNFIHLRKAARRASFINTVTSQRVLWIERLRQDVARFVGLTHSWTRTDGDDSQLRSDLLKEIDTLRYVIPLRLNPDDTNDSCVAALVKRIPDLTDQSMRAELDRSIAELVELSQKILKAEWEKVKAEAKDGDLKDA